MRPEDVPVQFSADTIQIATTTWLMGTMNFGEQHASELGQLFAIVVGRRIRAEAEGYTFNTAEVIKQFVQLLSEGTPQEVRAEFRSLDPNRFDESYAALMQIAREKNLDLAELSHALIEIAAVASFAVAHMKAPEA